MPVKVIATALGLYDCTRRRPGDVFLVDDDLAAKGASWFHPVGAKAQPRKPGPPRITAPGNANATHVPGSAEAEATKRGVNTAAVLEEGSPVVDDKAKGSGDRKVI